MKKYTLILLLLLLRFIPVEAQPLTVTLRHSVIVDTDCGIDDLRALSLLLDRPEITIHAILLSDGSLPPSEGFEKVTSLLNEFNRNMIPVACGETIKGIDPPWREFNRQIRWGKMSGNRKKEKTNATDFLADMLRESEEKIILVCLGPLTNVAGLIRKDPSLLSKTERIIWYNDSAKPMNGFNYECDKEAADIVLKSKTRIDLIANLDKPGAFFDIPVYDLCSRSETMTGKILNYVHSQPLVMEKLKQNHFRLYDDLVAIYLTNPELFNMNTGIDRLNLRHNVDYYVNGVREAMSDIITGAYVSEHNVVFNRFPVNREMFNYDVRPIIDSAVLLYGNDEWKANVMTDEFHGHLGVFSIVGAKMGIRARELFDVGPDVLDVTTFAGTKPPYSCLNDGIQVSTGATLGMGTIHLAGDPVTRPAAIFKYKDRSIKISLKKEYLEKVDADINEGILKFGLLDDGYWKLVRHNALKYWLEWDRNTIFDVEEISEYKEPAYAGHDTIREVMNAMLAMQRRAWEQGVASQALLELGEKDLVILLARDAVVNQKKDGRLGLNEGNSPVADPASNGEPVLFAAKATGDESLKKAADNMLDFLLYKAPRTPDGIIYHNYIENMIWVDAFYMLPPFLAAAGQPEEAVKQITGYRKILLNPDKKLYYHIWDQDLQKFERKLFWGVGNGWAAAGMTRVVRSLPSSMNEEKKMITGFIRELLDACLKYQREDGLFHDILDDPSTFVETNTAQMLAYTIFRGVKGGWLDDSYLRYAEKMRSAAHKKVDQYGLVQGVCGAPNFNHPGTATEGQAFFLLMEAARNDLRKP
jgi:rhamnogalacturonyl hydrolase YesR/inosine-uridine nucleoside N-ribohydrolase